MIEGSSVSKKVYNKVSKIAKNYNNVLVFLDSNHTKLHVKKELDLYSKLVTKNSYCVVFDTIIENVKNDKALQDRPWKKGNNPKNAVDDFMKNNKSFIIDTKITKKLLISAAPNGYLKRIK